MNIIFFSFSDLTDRKRITLELVILEVVPFGAVRGTFILRFKRMGAH